MRSVVRLGQGIYLHGGIFHGAQALAFHFFLSLLPLLAFLGYVLGLVAQRRGASEVVALLLDSLPTTTKSVLKQDIERLAAAGRLGPLAAIGFLWIGSGGAQALMRAIERVVGVPRRPWWRQRLIAVAWVLATLAGFCVASFAIIEWEEVVRPSEEVVASGGRPTQANSVGTARGASDLAGPMRTSGTISPHESALAKSSRSTSPRRGRRILRVGAERTLAVAFSLLVATSGLAGFYYVAIARAPRSRRRVWPGALLAMALLVVVSWGFGLYVRTLASYTVYYGGLAAIAVLLVWLWLISLAILVGAEWNAQLEGLRD